MKALLAFASTFAWLPVCLFLTWCAWEMQMNGRAFVCNDTGISLAYWTSANLHQSAGDRIQPGWTWEEIATVNRFYRLGFFVLWIGGSVVIFRYGSRLFSSEMTNFGGVAE